ncbi:MAG: cell division protein FtsQ/DivIB [Cellulomonas sp.]|nr:cell division protein FtsQ/DivIB [Cellulomonas sp.]
MRLRTAPVAPEGLPVVQVPLDDTRALLAALTVVDALPLDQASQVATVAAPTQDTVTLTLTDGVQVLWGSAEDNALKAQVVATLRAAETLTDVTTIDVSAPQMPVLR